MRIKEAHNLKSCVDTYCKRYNPTITYREKRKFTKIYREVIKDLMIEIINYIITTGFIYKAPYMGKFLIVRKNRTKLICRNNKIKPNRFNIDFKATKANGKVTFFEGSKSYKIYWHPTKTKNRSYYNFKASRSFKEKLGQYINNNTVNYIDYESFRQ